MPEGCGYSQPEAIRAAMDKARKLDIAFGAEMRKGNSILSLIEDYRFAIARSREVMERSGMIEICTACAAKTPGGCCFKEVEDWYDPVLLLINSLLGCSLPDRREVSDNCIFLGESGCKIGGRYHFCVNYLCGRLKNEIGHDMMEEVMSASGMELMKGAELEYSIRRRLYLNGVDPD